jgi:hypothetical protein
MAGGLRRDDSCDDGGAAYEAAAAVGICGRGGHEDGGGDCGRGDWGRDGARYGRTKLLWTPTLKT